MKKIKIFTISVLTAAMMLTGCNSMNNTGKGALIGGGGGAALGAGLGAIIGGGKGAAIGSAIGAGVGAGAGALIGRKMDKQQQELERQLAESAKVEQVKDTNGLQAIKVTFNSGILFPTNGTTLSETAKNELAQFAVSLKNNPQTNVQIYGFTDNTGSMAVNQRVADGRSGAVKSYLVNSGVDFTRLTSQGVPMANYIASNDTAEGRAQNRRVEIYITANEQMIQQAEAGTLQ